MFHFSFTLNKASMLLARDVRMERTVKNICTSEISAFINSGKYLSSILINAAFNNGNNTVIIDRK